MSGMSDLPPPARYFPVSAGSYRMLPGLRHFGTDFGNGERDRMFYQRDDEAERYRLAKQTLAAERNFALDETDAQREAHAAVLAWMADTIRREHPGVVSKEGQTYESIALAVQEDFAVIQRLPGDADRTIAVSVASPSGWRPESIAGASFRQIHRPVPGFGDVDAANDSMLTSMIERGPYVRFVWTVTADDYLDHHPELGTRKAWSEDGEGWLRLERQVTVPFAAVGASLFLIRTYLYRFETLSEQQRRALATALEQMPADVAAYKGLTPRVRAVAQQLLEL